MSLSLVTHAHIYTHTSNATHTKTRTHARTYIGGQVLHPEVVRVEGVEPRGEVFDDLDVLPPVFDERPRAHRGEDHHDDGAQVGDVAEGAVCELVCLWCV